jgi:hypothetical protein
VIWATPNLYSYQGTRGCTRNETQSIFCLFESFWPIAIILAVAMKASCTHTDGFSVIYGLMLEVVSLGY